MRKKDIPNVRKQQLITATLKVIEEKGLHQTTIGHIAKVANMSVGIVSHYFGDKDNLMKAVMQSVLEDLKDAVRKKIQATSDKTARGSLIAIIEGNFDSSQINPAAMKVWLNFWASSIYSEELRQLQKINDHRLYSNLTWYLKQIIPIHKARVVARGLAAIIDGLWLRGSLASSQHFNTQEAMEIAIDFLDTQLAKYQAEFIKK